MKTNRLHIGKIILTLVLVLSFALISAPTTDARAAKLTEKKAQKILKKKVSGKFCHYAFIDLDNDKISEMVVLGYSGKFYQGDDKKKTITVYKVVNGKAKSLFSDSMKGDFFHPSITFRIYSDPIGARYLMVNKEHEGYCLYTMYTLLDGKMAEITNKDVSDAEFKYFIRQEEVSEVEYEDFMGAMDEIDVKVISSSTKIANKYVRKLLKAEFNFECKNGVFDKDIVSPVFSDENGDGIDELIVREGPLGGKILYAYLTEYNYDYMVDTTEYSLNNGWVEYGD